ncbi:MAG: hypothetical protein M9887_05305 [Chitinophagales bacterium]|nr:hypothetical protein [Chitinophagales bacterium]
MIDFNPKLYLEKGIENFEIDSKVKEIIFAVFLNIFYIVIITDPYRGINIKCVMVEMKIIMYGFCVDKLIGIDNKAFQNHFLTIPQLDSDVGSRERLLIRSENYIYLQNASNGHSGTNK